MKHLNVRVNGKVQGVWFRASTKEEADRLGISGFVRNQADGSVYLEAEADKSTLDEFLAWLELGPPLAQVSGLEISEGEIKNFSGFDISHQAGS